MIQNPILPGFHPDPSIVRVGGDYYIPNSTFEWFPGVPIHHSRDLKHWRLIGHALRGPADESWVDLTSKPGWLRHYYLRVTQEDSLGTVLGIVLTDDGAYDELGDIEVNDWREFYLRAVIDGTSVQFHASPDGLDWRQIGSRLDATKISDDYGSTLRFTGAMIGICAQDLSGNRWTADFDYFELRENP